MQIQKDNLPAFVGDFLSRLPELVSRSRSNKQDSETSSERRTRATVVGLSGNLGAGKTTFTQEVACQLEVDSSVTSPTFVIMKKYPLNNQAFNTLVHIDAYRLDSGKDLEVLDFEELLEDPSNLIFIEWPEKVADILPNDMITITFEVSGEDERKIEIHGKDRE